MFRSIQSVLRLAMFGAYLLVSSQSGLLAQVDTWRATWTASPSASLTTDSEIASSKAPASPDSMQTVRDIVHVTASGDRCRLRISNAFGKRALLISNTHVALQERKSSIVAGTDRTATFGGEFVVSIPPGADVLSDPIAFDVPQNGNLAVSFTTTGRRVSDTIHFYALQTSYTAPGDQAASAMLREATDISVWPFLTEVQVSGKDSSEGTVVAFGDSITDGAHSTPQMNRRWPNRLFERFTEKGLKLAVTNAGLAGNRLLHDGDGPYGAVFGVNALARFDRDVLSQAGIRYLIVLLGINDIGQPGSGGVSTNSVVTTRDIQVGLSQLAARAHEHGIRVVIGTLLPFGGATAEGYFSPSKEQMRVEVNQWIRTSGDFDAVADFDLALQDPADKTRMLPAFDGGDHLHPSDAGAKAIADAVPLKAFRRTPHRK